MGLVSLITMLAVIALRDGDKRQERASNRPAQVGNGELEFMPRLGWTSSTNAPRLRGMEIQEPVVLEEPVSGMRLVAGLLPATSPTLLPPEFVRRLRMPAARPQTIRLGDALEAYYFAGLSSPDARGLVDVYAAPTTAGIVTIACVGGPGIVAPYYDCWRNASTLKLLHGHALPLGPDAAFRQRLPGTITALDSARQRARSQLSTRVPEQQAAAASDLAAAYGVAAASLAPLAPASLPWSKGLVQELAGAGREYRGLVAALQRADAGAFGLGQDAVHARERRIKQLLERPARW